MRAVMFDLDGVLVDSWHVAEAAFCDATAALGLDGPAHIGAFRRRLGMPLDQIRQELHFPEGFCQLFLETARRLDHEAVPFAGVPDLLAGLKAEGWRVGVVTGKDSARASTILAAGGLARHVDALVGGEAAPRGKPHPDPLWLCEAWLGAGDAVGYIGDTAIDALAAERAGRAFFHAVWDGAHTPPPEPSGLRRSASPAAIRTGKLTRRPPRQMPPRFTVETPAALLSLLRRPARTARYG